MNTHQKSPIICGTDFSKNAQAAADVAAALASRLETSLVLVHAYVRLIHGIVADVNEMPSSLRECLRMEAERLRARGATVEEVLVEGVSEDVLAEMASQHSAQIVIVSSLGMNNSTRWFTGSTAVRTAESSTVPTLVVRDAAPFEQWARGERSLKVFAGVDFSVSSDAALRWIAELRQLGPVEVVVGYVDWPPEEVARLGISGPTGLIGNPPMAQNLLERDLLEKATRLLGSEEVTIRVEGNWGRADHPLVGMAVESQADLIVVGTHQRSGFRLLHSGSVSRCILNHAPMSVACIPKPVAERMAGPIVRTCQRVLVAVDLDEPHGFAAAYAYSIINPGGTVRLVYNLVPSSRLGQPNESGQLVADYEKRLFALAPSMRDGCTITTEVEITESWETAESICAAAERFGADIICIGSHTRPGFTAKVMGSVSLAVLQHSQRPVLVVRPPSE